MSWHHPDRLSDRLAAGSLHSLRKQHQSPRIIRIDPGTLSIMEKPIHGELVAVNDKKNDESNWMARRKPVQKI
ncbi:MAG: hypothetical protein J0H75_00325 [Rhizobiales bacterium]|nr:hypothetical protein [Hyphomicrobiales bacterium]